MFSLGALYGANSERWVSHKVIGWQQGLAREQYVEVERTTVTGTNDLNFRKSRNVGRPCTAQQHEQTVRRWLEEPRKPRMMRSSPVKYSLASKLLATRVVSLLSTIWSAASVLMKPNRQWYGSRVCQVSSNSMTLVSDGHF